LRKSLDRSLIGLEPDQQAALRQRIAAGQLAFCPRFQGRPGLTTALREQLGLKLEATRGPVEVLVIDSVERPTPD
jgi:uncharacterized protein (TIGR03435 family)